MQSCQKRYLLHRELGKLDDAMECLQSSLAICEKLGLLFQISQPLQDIGSIHRLKGDYQQAFNYYQKAFSMHKKFPANSINDFYKAWSCYYLIVLITRNFPEKDVSIYLEEFEQLEKEGNFSFLKCTACGARHTIKSKVRL